jgi:predicted MFS family arabinose efflux permease
MASEALDPAKRKRVIRVLFISLLLDLVRRLHFISWRLLTWMQISFTFILPLFPSLLSFYRALDTRPTSLLNRIIHYLNAYKRSFSIPINSKYDIVLLGGALGSLFSLLQAIASPIIGRASDKYGRRTALLWSMAGNIASVALWCAATDFRTFLLSRVIGGLSEGNVQLATAIAADISDENQRGSTMALVGACFSIAFTFGPALGAALANIKLVAANPFATAAGFSLLLILIETLYLYLYLPETRPSRTASQTDNAKQNGSAMKNLASPATQPKTLAMEHTNHPTLLNLTHFLFLLPFSGLEFSLPFLLTTTLYPNHSSPSKLNGRLLGFIGLVASLLQGSIVRRLPPLLIVRTGICSCAAAFFLLARTTSSTGLYVAGALLAVTSAMVVTGLNSLGSFETADADRGKTLGALRSYGQFGRALGPVVFCSLFWWAGREIAYTVGGCCMLGVAGLVFGVLKSPSATKSTKENRGKTQ